MAIPVGDKAPIHGSWHLAALLYLSLALTTPNRADGQLLDSASSYQSVKQIGTGGFALAAGLPANSAVLMLACVTLTFNGAACARDSASH
jgi:hypothetical protein